MKNFRFNYIITIHNKQDLIRQVLEGLLLCCKENSCIYPVLDGCTDNTEKIIDEIITEHPDSPIVKLYAPDVYELKTINIGLRAAPQGQKGCNIILQDDVVIREPDLENIVFKIYEHFGYEKIGYLSFRHGVNIYLKDRPEISEIFRHRSQIIEERDLIESAYGTGMSPIPLPPHNFVERMVSVGSPQCISCDVVNKVGIMDENLAPDSYSCHDLSLRCLEVGRKNLVFGLNFASEIQWGGTRNNVDPGRAKFMLRNQGYLYKKHKVFLEKFCKSSEFYRLKITTPFEIPGISVNWNEKRDAIKQYYYRRKKTVGLRIHLISKFIKLPLKWILIRLRLY